MNIEEIKEWRKKWGSQINQGLTGCEVIDRLIEEVEQLKEGREDDIANYCNDILAQFAPQWVGKSDLFTWIKCTVAKLQAAETSAAQHLADQVYLIALERKRVAREIADFIKNHRIKWAEGMQTDQIERNIRAKYGVGE